MSTVSASSPLNLDTLSNADWQLAFADLPKLVETTTYAAICRCQDQFDHGACLNETPLIFAQARSSCEQ